MSRQNCRSDPVEPTEITDFVQGEDIIHVDHRRLDPYSDGLKAELEIVVRDDGTGADIVVGDQVVAGMPGGQAMAANDIVTGDSPERDVLGCHHAGAARVSRTYS